MICFFRSVDAGGGWSSITHCFLKEGIEAELVFPGVLLLFIDDECWVAENAVTDGFAESLKGLSIGYKDQNILAVFPGQFPDPFREIEIFLFYVFRILIEILVILLIFDVQAQLV